MITLDRVSMLVEASGDVRLEELEATLARDGYTLALAPDAPLQQEVSEWLADGARGAQDPWVDPVDHLVAGLEATLVRGTADRKITLRPTPRRAAGPDLVALVVGMRGRFARATRVWLRMHPSSAKATRPAPEAFTWERDPTLDADEEVLLASIERAFEEMNR
jgi:alkyldihydroxyacetonephosphate synthase